MCEKCPSINVTRTTVLLWRQTPASCGLETVSEPGLAYIVDGVDYCIDQADDMVAGGGDYSYCEPQPRLKVLVVDLDRSAYPICKRS